MNATMQKLAIVKSTNQHTTDPNQLYIKNGYGIKNEGYRQVVFDPSGEVRPVRTIRSNGKLQDRHTQQIARNGDFVLRHQWFPSLWVLYQFKVGKGLVEVSLKEHAGILAKLPKALDEWMAIPTEYSTSYLPAGCGWDGVETESSKQKTEKLRRLFKGLDNVIRKDGVNWLDEFVRHARLTPFHMLQQEPVELNPPAQMEFCQGTRDWVAIDENGHRELFLAENYKNCWETLGLPFPAGTKQVMAIDWIGHGSRLGVRLWYWNI